ncbi:iron chelate uptake ABC transporter family permease subunit [Micromonospora sp. NBC_01813]|uniref:iron chelate uptake ABC transporter family permease subunit n=1 Tax=Micromonospora sp. NBC_01813 TaxID=2975988 RepID=UPI002DD9A3BE|nr:iron chelate uptake ABC transporter family permease subunit [Micromonospora sp. NBC_01813]WSA10803.1 iron ABC transporter permease [Micromonospora sp. NBC_01813]
MALFPDRWHRRLPVAALGLMLLLTPGVVAVVAVPDPTLVLAAAAAGAGLGLAGVCLRTLLRDPLADPQLVGVSSGAALGAVVALALGATATVSVAGSAFVGALAGLLVVLVLARARPASGVLLTGVGVTYAATALVAVAQSYTTPRLSPDLVFWLLGADADGIWAGAAVPASATVLCAGVLMSRTRAIDAAIADADSTAFRMSATRTRVLLLVACALLTAASVSSVGGVGFVGLLASHAAQRLVGVGHLRVMPVAMVIGAATVVAAVLVSQRVGSTGRVPVGVVTAAVGAPLFITLLRSRTRSAR